MRNYVLALGLVAMGMQAEAQSHSYNKTVFNDAAQQHPFSTEQVLTARSQVNRSFPGWHISLDKVSGTFNDIFGNAMSVPGSNNEARAIYAIDNLLKDMGINSADWHKVRDVAAPKASYVDFEQTFNNHPVKFARLSFRFTKDGRLVRIKNTSYGTPAAGNNVKLTAQDVLQADVIMADAAGLVVSNKTVANDWVWFPVPSGSAYELHPAWQVSVSAKEEGGHPVELVGYIDATNGELLYRENKIEEISDVTVKGMVYASNTLLPATLEPLADLDITINSVAGNLDANGFISDAANNITVDFALQGRWSKVIVAGGVGTPSFPALPFTGTGNVYTFPNTGSSSDRAVNAYYHTTRIHDFMKPYFPGFNSMDFALPTNVDLTSGTCNAFFNGTSINFYAAGGGCKSFAEIGDIIYHEYGHGINSYFYNFHGSVNFSNGAMGEGTADVWGMSITKDSVLGRNTSTPTSFIRRYDINPKVYPEDIKGEVHADGEIIAGAWYDYAKNVGSFSTMTDLFASTYYDLPNGPNGTEGAVYHDVLISALMNDDNDANFSNGTPHFTEITTAFAKHGIYLLADATLEHSELAHQPANAPIDVTAKLTLVNPEFFQSLKLMYKARTSSNWDTLTMSGNNGTYTATIPAQSSGTIIDYYFHVYDILALPSAIFPNNFFADASLAYRSNLPYQFGVGIHVVKQTTFDDGPVTNWTIGATDDNATAGKWIQAKPTGTFSSGIPVQTGKDHTTGTGQCMVTGNGTGSSINSADVDGGKTTLITPELDLTNYVYPMIEYYRWFSNDKGSIRRNDSWLVQIKSVNSVLPYNVENTLQADNTWRRKIFAVSQYLNTNYGIIVRFIAADKSISTSGQQTIEAAIDDFFIYDGVPLSVNDVAPVKASIFPNPADDKIQVVLPDAVKGTMTMYDAMGRVVNAYSLDGVHTHYSINTAAYAAGNYTLMIQTDTKTIQSRKVVITHR
jgi:hypothetical protein